MTARRVAFMASAKEEAARCKWPRSSSGVGAQVAIHAASYQLRHRVVGQCSWNVSDALHSQLQLNGQRMPKGNRWRTMQPTLHASMLCERSSIDQTVQSMQWATAALDISQLHSGVLDVLGSLHRTGIEGPEFWVIEPRISGN
jgi:hypothetical protein